MSEETIEYNRRAWNQKVKAGNQWTQAVSTEEIARARTGDFQIVLTPFKPVPKTWLGNTSSKKILCLASGGGQQAPILAATGAEVTTLDLSENQLAQDRLVAEREGLEIRLEQGDMRDLSRFEDGSFDLIFHPVSNCFVPDVQVMWKEAFRVLRAGGSLLAGFANPVLYLFPLQGTDGGELVVRHTLPYSDEEQLSQQDIDKLKAEGEPLEFGHTLEQQIGGQLEVGFVLKGLYEDKDSCTAVAKHMSTFIATWAFKPG